MQFAKGVFSWAFPPATHHSEQYYAFLGVALAWQFAFRMIGRHPVRYRPMMLVGVSS